MYYVWRYTLEKENTNNIRAADAILKLLQTSLGRKFNSEKFLLRVNRFYMEDIWTIEDHYQHVATSWKGE